MFLCWPGNCGEGLHDAGDNLHNGNMTLLSAAFVKWYLVVSAVVTLGALGFLSPIAQDPRYHDFADQRSLLGIRNGGDVLSNVFFLVGGVLGVVFLKRAHQKQPLPTDRLWLGFFIGVGLTAFGSSFYHLRPDSERLMWDRLPMTLAFASLNAAVIGEQLAAALGRRLWPWLVATAALSVVYWRMTESWGQGDLRFYAWVQFYPLVFALPMLLLARPLKGRRGIVWLILFAGYGLAKATEALDEFIFQSLGETISGHSLKHICAGAGILPLAFSFRDRTATTTSNID